ncbi:MAG TPA: hypothetical protein VFN13_02810 [Rudaea sp.]|nr:hypothetical protein [Rudaea sp.]
MRRHCPIIFATAFAVAVSLQGCKQRPDPAKVQADIIKAQANGQKAIADARANMDKVIAQNRKDLVDARVDAQMDHASGDETARNRQSPAANLENPSAVASPVSAAVARARKGATDSTADAQYELDKAKAEADYNVALARCESRVGTALDACKETAKSRYDSDITAARHRNDSAHQPNSAL